MPAAAYPRDRVGYGERPPHARWPGGAPLALQIVLYREDDVEASVLHGNSASEVATDAFPGTA
jgi:allantoinase